MMITTAQNMLIIGNVFSAYGVLRLVDIAPVVLGVFLAVRHKNGDTLICAVLLAIFIALWGLPYFSIVFLICNMLFIFRSVILLDFEWNNSHHHITQMSVKEAIDGLSSGVLYTNNKGKLILENISMSHILTAIGIAPSADKSDLWGLLCNLYMSYDVHVQVIEDKLMMRLRNGGSWLFSKEEVTLKRHKYTQILALDITNEDLLTQEIEASNAALETTGNEIADAMRNIEQTEKVKEILRMKANMHDALGHRLSILHHYLDDTDATRQLDRIKSLLSGLDTIITADTYASNVSEMQLLIDSYAMIGTQLHITGSPPGDTRVASTLSKILRECATNALRHVNAKTIHAVFAEDDRNYTLSVSNDGALPLKIIEGGGIKGMRGRLAEIGGSLEMQLEPEFCIIVKAPKERRRVPRLDDGANI
jgi:signal transduction histidine kinase